MRALIYFLLFSLLASNANASNSLWSRLSYDKKVEVIHALKKFNSILSKDKRFLISETKIEPPTFSFIPFAYAEEGYNCFYGGWPSETIKYNNKTYCSSPKNKNTSYKEDYANTCEKTSTLCNPLLFGDNLCVEGKTRTQRVYTYANCEKLFKEKNRTVKDIIQKINEDEKLQQRFQEMLLTAKSVCSQSWYQGKTGMCKILMKRMETLEEEIKKTSTKETKKEEEREVEVKKPEVKNETPVVVTKPKIEKDEVIDPSETTKVTISKEVIKKLTKLNNKVQKLNEKVRPKAKCFERIVIPEADYDRNYWEISEKIDQTKPTDDNFCHEQRSGNPYEKYSQTHYHSEGFEGALDLTYYGKINEKKNVEGFTIQANRFGKAYPYVESKVETDKLYYPHRSYEYDFPGRGKEAMFTVVDSPIKEKYAVDGSVIERYPSSDIKITNYMFFPRNFVPSVTQKDGKSYMTLTTGEKVVFDSESGQVDYGAFSEENANTVETRPKNKRFYPDKKFSYQGEGIWIEAKTTYSRDDISTPGTLIPIHSNVGGKSYTCKMKSEELFKITSGHYLKPDAPKYDDSKWSCNKFRFETDKDFYAAIKKKCPSFKFPRLTE